MLDNTRIYPLKINGYNCWISREFIKNPFQIVRFVSIEFFE